MCYSSFETNTAPRNASLLIGVNGGALQAYAGNLWEVTIRLYAARLANGLRCMDDSDGVVLKKVTGVDP